MYLLDTNVFLELLLHREHAEAVIRLLQSRTHSFYISDFSFHSIGLHLFNKNKKELFLRFAEDMFRPGGIQVISLEPQHLPYLVTASSTYRLDFDDAYQYAISKNKELILVSYDRDFDKTPEKRMIPEEIIG